MQAPSFHQDPEGWARWFWDLGFFRFGVQASGPGSDLVRGWTVPCEGPCDVARELLRQEAAWPSGVPLHPLWPVMDEDVRLLMKDPYRIATAVEDAQFQPGARQLARLYAEDLPRISRGAFQPIAVDEAWNPERTHAAAVFGSPGSWSGRKRGVWMPWQGFDVRLAEDVNSLVPADGPFLRFIGVADEAQPCLFVTDKEARLLERERGWRWDPGQATDADGRPKRGVLEDWPPEAPLMPEA